MQTVCECACVGMRKTKESSGGFIAVLAALTLLHTLVYQTSASMVQHIFGGSLMYGLLISACFNRLALWIE